MAVVTVSSSAALMSVLSGARGGDTIVLKAGNYGTLSLDAAQQTFAKFAGEVTIKSADASNPAVISRMQLKGVQNLTLDGIKFDYDAAPGTSDSDRPFRIEASRNVTVRNSVFDGDEAAGLSSALNGYGTGIGLTVGSSSQITVENSEFLRWYRGATFGSVTDLSIVGNDVHTIRSDGFNFANVDNVLIEDNHIHDFRSAPSSGDHPDMIQFWTTGTTSPSTNVVIRDNFLDSGGGSWTQSIFMRNEMVDQNQAGSEMFYQSIRIENNVIHNGHWHGITIGETDGLTIRNNTVTRNPAHNRADTPWIDIADASKNVSITNNVMARKEYIKQSGWVDSGNVIASGNALLSYFVDPLTGADATIESFARKAGVTVGANTTQVVLPDGDANPTAATAIYGTNGNDVLKGTPGIDAMYGGSGNDTYYVTKAGDTAYERSGQGIDKVISTISYSLAGQHIENLSLSGTSNVNGTGNSLNNVLLGNSGANTLKGGGGNDTINGNSGQDILFGGLGSDAFVFDTQVEANGDTITDFVYGVDRISLRSIDANIAVTGDQAFTFIGAQGFHRLAGELKAYQSNGDTYLAGDVNGDGSADFKMKVIGAHTFANTDFSL